VGERGYLSTIDGLLALALTRQHRYDEAEAFADNGRQIGSEDDHITQIYWRVAKAHVAGHRGDGVEAARLAAEVMDLARDFDSFDGPIAAVEIAMYLEPDAAREALERGLRIAEAKGNVVTSAQAREKLAALP
jgi:hypothetical protein